VAARRFGDERREYPRQRGVFFVIFVFFAVKKHDLTAKNAKSAKGRKSMVAARRSGTERWEYPRESGVFFCDLCVLCGKKIMV